MLPKKGNVHQKEGKVHVDSVYRIYKYQMYWSNFYIQTVLCIFLLVIYCNLKKKLMLNIPINPGEYDHVLKFLNCYFSFNLKENADKRI